MKAEITKWFAIYSSEYGPDEMCQAAENCANELGHDEWLDDPDHLVWEIAAQWI